MPRGRHGARDTSVDQSPVGYESRALTVANNPDFFYARASAGLTGRPVYEMAATPLGVTVVGVVSVVFVVVVGQVVVVVAIIEYVVAHVFVLRFVFVCRAGRESYLRFGLLGNAFPSRQLYSTTSYGKCQVFF